MSASLDLIHRTSNRWRFRLTGASQIKWDQFHGDLVRAFPTSQWMSRLNPLTFSVVIVRITAHPKIHHDASADVRATLCGVLLHQGIIVSQIPLSPSEVVDAGDSLTARVFRQAFTLLANGVSMSLSLSALLTALALFIIGFVGLFVPLSPGFWVLMLATLLFDFALTLRRPFVKTV